MHILYFEVKKYKLYRLNNFAVTMIYVYIYISYQRKVSTRVSKRSIHHTVQQKFNPILHPLTNIHVHITTIYVFDFRLSLKYHMFK